VPSNSSEREVEESLYIVVKIFLHRRGCSLVSFLVERPLSEVGEVGSPVESNGMEF
jgi:hypothetical protein